MSLLSIDLVLEYSMKVADSDLGKKYIRLPLTGASVLFITVSGTQPLCAVSKEGNHPLLTHFYLFKQ